MYGKHSLPIRNITKHSLAPTGGDVPYLLQSSRFNLDTIKVIASTTVQYYLHGDNVPDKNITRSVESSASSISKEGKWINVNSKIRVLPILSQHAPHYKKCGINIYVVPKKTRKNISAINTGDSMLQVKHSAT